MHRDPTPDEMADGWREIVAELRAEIQLPTATPETYARFEAAKEIWISYEKRRTPKDPSPDFLARIAHAARTDPRFYAERETEQDLRQAIATHGATVLSERQIIFEDGTSGTQFDIQLPDGVAYRLIPNAQARRDRQRHYGRWIPPYMYVKRN